MLECVTTSGSLYAVTALPSVEARPARAALNVGAHGKPGGEYQCISVKFNVVFGQPWQPLCVRVLDSAKQRWSRQRAETSPQQCSQTATFPPQHCYLMTARVHELAATPEK